MEKLLLIDGYNVIGSWVHLRKLQNEHFQQARDILIDTIANYQAYTGTRCMIVFDAYKVKSPANQLLCSRVEVHFTKRDETADAFIERQVRKMASVHLQIYVATSDYSEQMIAFGSGALRLSVDDLWQEVQRCQAQLRAQTQRPALSNRNTFDHRLSPEHRNVFERWRKGLL
jgi:predicted RNA-binding protein with PIN domain